MRTGKHIQNPPVPRGPLRLAAVAAVAGGVLGLSGTGPAAADPVSLTLRYTCSTGLIGNLPVTVQIHSDFPASAEAGKPTPAFPVSATVPVPADAARALGGIGVTSVEGTVEAQARVAAPEGDSRVSVPVEVKARIPAAGSFRVETSGSAPSLTFRQTGSARITVGDLVAHLALKDARGRVVYPGRIDARCTPEAGQNNVLASFRITGAGAGAGAGTGTGVGVGAGTGTDTGQAAPGATGPAGTAAAPGAPAADRTASGATDSTPQGALPETGARPDLWLLGGAGLLLAAGAVTFAAARRTRTDDGAGDAAAS
ncbi:MULTISPECIES: DUF6801 domain-containing protein [unclassified Streptomyces]|uniref:DUF6801 domain-containing protein n=1 Tax=unclassified Streptomyces TaxID=2593676 RepID=UPI0028884664|nr:hypothetical protein [Streptomyces sp. DSM 41633]